MLGEEFIPTTRDKMCDDHVQDTIFWVTNETELLRVEQMLLSCYI